MSFNKEKLIVEHHVDNLCAEALSGYVAHVICRKGELTFKFVDRAFVLHAGEAMIIVQQLVQDLQSSKDFDAICIYVRRDFVEFCTPSSNYGIKGTFALFACPVMQMDAAHFEQLENDFLQIESRLLKAENSFQEEMLGCVTQLMFLDFFDIHALQHALSDDVSFQDSEIIGRFIQMLEQGDYIKNRAVDYYAEKLCVTPKYLSEVCKAVSGMGANY